MSVALFTHPACLDHLTPAGHAERVERLRAVLHALASPAFAALDRRTAPPCPEAALLRAHPRAHLDRIAAASPAQGWAMLDPDTFMSPGSAQAALHAAGAVVAAVDSVLTGQARRAFCAIRPPGHHAEATRPMGFCLYSNAAIGALHALEHHRLARVAVVDFDVHHGNGTQDILWSDPRAMFISSQQMPLYPGTGAAEEIGAHGQILNLPLPPGAGGDAMRAAWGGTALPALRAFAPELLIVSAGFDAHADDPLANLEWHEDDFAWLTRALCDLADEVCAGRVVSTLEGGYDLNALAACVAAHVGELMKGPA
jgi:acetoin utilization deacetylase AcuC-like enzyme